MAEAIVYGSKEKGIELVKTKDFQSITGKGVTGEVDGDRVAVGNIKLLESLGINAGDLLQQANKQHAKGKTVMLVAINGQSAGLIGVADSIKDSTTQAIRDLNPKGIKLVMLTGDSRTTAEAVANKLNIDEVRSEVLPEQKVEIVKQLQADGRVVAMADDGINDAPALHRRKLALQWIQVPMWQWKVPASL